MPVSVRRCSARFAILILVAISVAAGLTVTTAEAAPASITFYGHGYGHGRGMGQYGAQGYATTYGWSSAQILDHYYSNTYAAGLGTNPPISVWLQAQDGSSPVITSGAPFRVSDSANPGVYYDQPAGAGVRAVIDGSGKVSVSGLTGCGGALLGYVQLQGQAMFTSFVGDPGANLSQMLTVCGGPTYRGSLRYLAQPGGSRMTNDVALESYLRGVVPRESPAWFAPAALQAQAVAARSYSWADGGEGVNRYPFAKTCDTTACQVYGGAGLAGVSRETAQTDAAIAATTGLVRRLAGGALARTEFSSSTGGWTTPGTFPAVVDLGDSVSSNSRHSWSTTLSTASIANAYGIGGFVDVVVTRRTGYGEWGGRVLTVDVVGTARTVSVTGAAFQSSWGLFSTWFSNTPGVDTVPGPGVGASGDTLGVTARGSDSAVYFATVPPGGGPTAWQSLGGYATSSAAVSSWGPGRYDVFIRGGDGALYSATYADGAWSGWTPLGGLVVGAPSAVSWGPGRIDVFVTGADGALWSRGLTDGAWSPWYTLGGRLVGGPTVTSRGVGMLDAFATGSDQQVFQVSWTGSQWTGWIPQGGLFTSGPASVTSSPGRIDLFGRGGDGALYTKTWTGSAWTGWSSLGGIFASAPAAASASTGDVDVLVRVFDGTLYRIRRTGASWGGWAPFASAP